MPSPWTLRTVAEPPRRAIRACTDSASPFRSPGTAAGSNPRPRSRTNSDTSAGSTSAKSETTLGTGPLHGVDRRLARRRQQGGQVVVELAVPDGDGLDGHPVLGLDLLLDEPHPGGQRQACVVHRAGRPAVEQPGAQLALLRPGQLDDLLRIARPGAGSGRASAAPSHAPGRPCRPAPRPGSGPGARRRGRGRSAATRGRAPPRSRRSPAPPRPAAAAAAMLSCADSSMARPMSAAAGPRSATRSRGPPVARCPRSGPAAARPGAASSPARPRGRSARSARAPAALMTSGQARMPSQPAPSTEAMSSTTTSSDPRPAASAMPRRSVRALLAMLRVLAGRGHQQPGHHVGGHAEAAQPGWPARTRVRTTVTSRPVRREPAATPPASRSPARAAAARCPWPAPPAAAPPRRKRRRRGQRPPPRRRYLASAARIRLRGGRGQCHAEPVGFSTCPSSRQSARGRLSGQTLIRPARHQGRIGGLPDARARARRRTLES